MTIYFFVNQSDCADFTKAKSLAVERFNNAADFYLLSCLLFRQESFEPPKYDLYDRLTHRTQMYDANEMRQRNSIIERMDLVCPSELDRIIVSNEKDKRLIFVVNGDELDYYGNIFKGKMQNRRFPRFAYHKEIRQDFFTGPPTAVVTTGGLNEVRDEITGGGRH